MNQNETIQRVTMRRTDWQANRKQLRTHIVAFALEITGDPPSILALDPVIQVQSLADRLAASIRADYQHQRFERGVGVDGSVREVVENNVAFSKVTVDEAREQIQTLCVQHIITLDMMRVRQSSAASIIKRIVNRAYEIETTAGLGVDPMYGIDQH